MSEKFEIKGNYYNGEFHFTPKSGSNSADRVISRKSPADLDTLLWEVPVSFKDIDAVVSSAQEGFTQWRKTKLEERIEILRKYQEKVKERLDDIATAIALETGKPLWESKTEANALIAKVDVTIDHSLPRIKEWHIDNILPNTTGHVYYKPIGPCLIIGPFNFPCHLANGQIVNSLISGNSIIFKPSEKTAYSAQIMFECLASAGFPKNVVNLIQGDGELSSRLTREKRIKGIFFTGSKEVGKKILSTTHTDLTKLVSLELGGKNCSIVHKDANTSHALTELVSACFLTSGQRCISTSIVPIHKSLLDEMIEKFHSIAKRIIIDHPIDHELEPFMGPLIDQQAVDNYLLFMGIAKREGIEEVMRGKQLEKRFQGHYVSPSIHLAKKFDPKSHFLQSEIFGPNCTFVPFEEIEEAIEITNSTEYGLAASIFTKDQSIYEQCLLDIECGQVNLNRSTVGASSRLPFGGVKNSGNYRPAAVTTIDACVYQMASLEIDQVEDQDISSIPRLYP